MKCSLITPENWTVTLWSGGSTSQLAIAPEGAVYANRDFLWRISSAVVELEESDFTPLPDYNRWIAVLEGSIHLSHEGRSSVTLEPGVAHFFDGGIATHCRGRCRDFNLMLRKGACTGTMEHLELTGVPVTLTCGEGETVLLFCHRDSCSCCTPEGIRQLLPQQGLLMQDGGSLTLGTEDRAELILCRMRSL